MAAHRPHQSYEDHVDRLVSRFSRDQALRTAVGGEFNAVGKLEYHLLRALGLQETDLVIDVGCGSGRLAAQLSRCREVRYLGCDIEPRLLAYAREISERPDWSFLVNDGCRIPAPAEQAQFVCFFSVFTHLPPEHAFRYLMEAQRVLVPGGCVVLSFLEFRIRSHWVVFEQALRAPESEYGRHLNQFTSRDALEAWAEHAGLLLEQVHDGDRPHIPIPEEIRWENGARMGTLGHLGQSVAVLRKPLVDVPLKRS